jgi:bacteriorhodopsin
MGVDETLSVNGSNWLWAVTAVYLVAFVSPCFLRREDFHLPKL